MNKSIERAKKEYGNTIRRYATRLWKSDISFYDFVNELIPVIRSTFTKAWHEGAASCGILPNELKPDELAALEAEISSEISYLMRFAGYIYNNNKNNNGHLRNVLVRANLWKERYYAIYAQAKTMACADKKLKWVVNFAKEHCSSCMKLDKKVKRASVWAEAGVYPKAWDKLNCHINCHCTFEETDEPATPGRLPDLP